MSADESLAGIARVLADEIVAIESTGRPVFFGICGPQGAGKSTLAGRVDAALRDRGRACAVLSLDDFYLSRAARQRLARDIHPLCAVRGVPGTHDAAELLRTLRALHDATAASTVRLPRFSKVDDDRLPPAEWPEWTGAPDCVILEGWCVGARPSAAASWRGPINAREARDDPDGRWWRWSNDALGRDYPECWAMLDRLCGIAIESIDDIVEGRLRQERDNVRERPGARPMSRDEITEFVSLFERLTRVMQAELRSVADYVVRRDADFHYRLD